MPNRIPGLVDRIFKQYDTIPETTKDTLKSDIVAEISRFQADLNHNLQWKLGNIGCNIQGLSSEQQAIVTNNPFYGLKRISC